MQSGHYGNDCKAELTTNPSSYAGAALKAIVTAPQEVRPTQKQSVVPFWGYKDTFSNHHPAVFTHAVTTYKSTEHFLFEQKALAMGNQEAAKEILNVEHAGKAKALGEKIPWDVNNRGPWATFAYNALWLANSCKYEQNKEMRKQLFDSAPNVLVEASPRDKYWGAGIDRHHRSINDPSHYPGQNTFGLLLTKLRDKMMQHDNFALEVTMVHQKRTSESELLPDEPVRKMTK